MKFLATPLLALSLFAATTAIADETVQVGDLEISGAFTRATLPNQPVGGGYLTITNTGDTDDRLVSGTTSIANALEIHEMTVENDIMTMRALPDGLVIPAGETVTLEPGGYHLMLMGLQEAIVIDSPVRVTLEFENAGAIELDLAVAPAGARTAPDQDHGAHHDAEEHHHDM